MLLAGGSAPAHAAIVAAPYSGSYSITDLGAAPGVPTSYGGLVFQAGDPNTLLLGGSANSPSGRIFAVGVNRDASNHVVSLAGVRALVSTAPDIDGGLAYGPNGVLFFTAFPDNSVGEIKAGSASPDKTVSLTSLGVTSSVGTLAFVPAGFPGAGGFKIASYNGGGFYSATLSSDGAGTFNITSATLINTPGGGPEGVAYVPLGSPLFPNPSMLISEYLNNKVEAFDVDANGNPILASRRDFITGLNTAEGATIDPLTGDFFFSTFGGDVIRVSGFAAPAAVPEPSSWILFAASVVGTLFTSRRRTSRS
jgi:PEP-CTERM motif